MAFTLFCLLFLGLLCAGLPLGFVFLVPSLVYMVLSDIPLVLAGQMMLQQFLKFVLIAIPLYIFAGELMNAAGVTNRIFNFAHSLCGHIRGGLGHVNVIASMIFAGMSGSAAADAAGLGRIEIKAMVAIGYRPAFAAAISASSSVIGPIIPPSIGLILYASIAEVGVDWLFLAGFLPGVLIGLALMVAIYLQVLLGREVCPVTPFPGWKTLAHRFVTAAPAVASPVVIVGGMVTGYFTPTEAGVIAVAIALSLGLIYRELSWEGFASSVMRSVRGTSSIMFILATVSCFAWVLTVEKAPDYVADLLLSLTRERWLLMGLILLTLLFLGLFETASANLLIVAPILVPIAPQLGLDLVHLGVVLVFALVIGNVTPPVGICLFIVQDITRLPMNVIVRANAPYLIALIIALILVAYLPEITLWLPKQFGYQNV